MNARPRRPTRQQAARGWYRIENSSGTGDRPAIVRLYDEIGFWGVSADDFASELDAITASTIELRVNSPGGEIFDGLAIYNALQRHPATVTAYVDSLAASAASFIVQAADKIIVNELGQMMIHDGIGFAFGNAADMRELADQLDKLSNTIAEIYSARSGTPADTWRTAMRAETWYNAQEAVDAGLADELEPIKRRESADNRAPLTQLWDLSPFRYAGRNAAPPPVVMPASRQPAPSEESSLFDQLFTDDSSAILAADDPFAALKGV